MSDIYLQITETPTVVTLSAPVVSGALASTVTVANTVTVALDANSLSALENVTVTVGAAITGTVTVSNLPATQTIAGTVTVGNSLTIQSGNISIEEAFGEASFMPISGTVTVGSLPAISGTVTANSTAQKYFSISAVTANRSIIGYSSSGGNHFTEWNGAVDAQVVISGSYWANGNPAPVSVANSVTIGSLPAISGTVTVGNTVTIAGTVTANPTGTQTIAGTVTANGGDGTFLVGGLRSGGKTALQLDAATGYLQTKVESLPSLVAGTAQIGSVTASISNSVTIGSLPAISGTVAASISNSVTIASFATSVTARLINPAGTAVTYAEVGTAGNPSIDVLSVQGVTSGTPLTILNHQGTTVTTSNFTSTTASTVLASANTSREVLTIFNEGAGNLHICAGATCTTIAYQVRLSAGDYYEVPLNQTSLTHSAVFATAGTARIVQIS